MVFEMSKRLENVRKILEKTYATPGVGKDHPQSGVFAAGFLAEKLAAIAEHAGISVDDVLGSPDKWLKK